MRLDQIEPSLIASLQPLLDTYGEAGVRNVLDLMGYAASIDGTDVNVVNDVNVIAPQGGHTINYAANPVIDPAATLTVSGGWCAPSATFTAHFSGIDPEVYRVLTGQPPREETLL